MVVIPQVDLFNNELGVIQHEPTEDHEPTVDHDAESVELGGEHVNEIDKEQTPYGTPQERAQEKVASAAGEDGGDREAGEDDDGAREGEQGDARAGGGGKRNERAGGDAVQEGEGVEGQRAVLRLA